MSVRTLLIAFVAALVLVLASGCGCIPCDSCCPECKECPEVKPSTGDPIPTPGPLIVIQPTTSDPNKLSYCIDGDESKCKVEGGAVYSASGNTFEIPEEFSGTKIKKFGCYDSGGTRHNVVALSASGTTGNDHDVKLNKSSIGIHWFVKPKAQSYYDVLLPTAGLDTSKVPKELFNLDKDTLKGTKSDGSIVDCVKAEFRVNEP